MTDPLLTSEPVPRVTAVTRGEIVTFRGNPTWVLKACPKAITAYVCVTHGVEVPTKEHLASHCKLEGNHIVGRLCSHGIEAPEPKAKSESA